MNFPRAYTSLLQLLGLLAGSAPTALPFESARLSSTTSFFENVWTLKGCWLGLDPMGKESTGRGERTGGGSPTGRTGEIGEEAIDRAEAVLLPLKTGRSDPQDELNDSRKPSATVERRESGSHIATCTDRFAASTGVHGPLAEGRARETSGAPQAEQQLEPGGRMSGALGDASLLSISSLSLSNGRLAPLQGPESLRVRDAVPALDGGNRQILVLGKRPPSAVLVGIGDVETDTTEQGVDAVVRLGERS